MLENALAQRGDPFGGVNAPRRPVRHDEEMDALKALGREGSGAHVSPLTKTERSLRHPLRQTARARDTAAAVPR